MITIYAVFMCWTQVNVPCKLLADHQFNGATIATAAQCEQVRKVYNGDGKSAPPGLTRAYKIVCLKKDVPAWEPSE